MKKCPKCGQTYDDKDLNFCYNDGELLNYVPDEFPTRTYSDSPAREDEPPPTEFLGSARITNETTWNPPPQAPPAVWQPNQPQQQYTSDNPAYLSPNQTLAIISLGLGIGSVTVGWCCSSGFVLSPAALVTGAIALYQIGKDPTRYGGRGFAIGGIIAGAIFLVIYLVIIIIYLIALLMGQR